MSLRNEVEFLLKTASTREEMGDIETSASLIACANRLVQAAEEEEKEEKGSRQMSGKAKAKFRAVKKACESLCAADLDYRGPYKKECRKIEQLCEEILDAIKDCDLE